MRPRGVPARGIGKEPNDWVDPANCSGLSVRARAQWAADRQRNHGHSTSLCREND